ncbi:hypothetical protein O181_096096 [Austropuccinia psidii MF-1]|uniref:Uncharacterized protein n=1 Tax=Austropuccinia psidii MF-1 TaxID=1389203 RepID=A0A9Q3J6R6_9BASI|nr:hypothetical protein [Austropuccinia psidii MF-1]
MSPKGASRGNHLAPKPQLDPPEPILATNPLDPNLAINPVGPNFGHGPPWTILPTMASGNHQRPQDQISQPFPQLKVNSTHSSMHPVLKVAGVVHNGPNSTIKNQGPKIQRPFQRRILQLISLAIHGGNQKTIQGSQSPGPAGVELEISFRIIPKEFSEVIQSFNQLSRHQVFQYSLDNSIGPYRRQSSNL